jgi:hypothetical protein
MQTFFYGWRRKTGIVTLVMALAVMGVWVRSFVVGDLVDLPLGRYTVQCFSWDGRFDFWLRFHKGDTDEVRSTGSWQAEQFGDLEVYFIKLNFDEDFNGVGVPVGEPLNIHYGTIAIPLTLLSACLILWKTRKPIVPTPPD